MPTIIDSLKVILGLDTSEYDAGKRKVDKGLQDSGAEADKTGAKFKKTGKDGADGFKTVAASAVKFLALIGGTTVVKRFIEDTIESSAALDRLAKNLQENVSTVSAWSNAAELAGGSADGLQGTLDMLSKSQTDLMLTGQSQLIPYFSALGVSIADASGKARSGNDILLDLADRFAGLDRTTANNMGRMMGIDPGTMNLLLQGRKEVELTIARQKEYGAVTKQQAEEASRMKRAMTESKQSFAAFGRELLSAATPALEGFFAMIQRGGAWMRENSEFVKDFLAVMAVGLATVAAATLPVNLTVVAVVALGAAIAALWQDYQTWKRGGDSFIDWAKWEPGFTAVGNGIKWLRDLLGDLVYRAIAAADMLSAVFDRDWKRAKFAAGEFMHGTGKKYGEDERKRQPAPAKRTEVPPAAPTPTRSAPVADQRQQEQRALEFFQSKGWTKEQAAGLAANIKRESSFNPAATGDNGQALGLAQWHPDRQAEFKKQFGKDMRGSSLDDQLAFMHFELTAGKEVAAGAKLRQAKTAEDAAAAVSTHYERPADKAGEAAKRSQLATEIVTRADVASPMPTYADRREAAGVPTPAGTPPAPRQPDVAPKAQPSPVAALGGIPGASMAAQGAGAGNVAMANAPAQVQEVSKSVETHIGEVKVYTAATDAKGIASDMGKSLDYLFTSQANYGLT